MISYALQPSPQTMWRTRHFVVGWPEEMTFSPSGAKLSSPTRPAAHGLVGRVVGKRMQGTRLPSRSGPNLTPATPAHCSPFCSASRCFLVTPYIPEHLLIPNIIIIITAFFARSLLKLVTPVIVLKPARLSRHTRNEQRWKAHRTATHLLFGCEIDRTTAIGTATPCRSLVSPHILHNSNRHLPAPSILFLPSEHKQAGHCILEGQISH